jgi:hypothetical protein
VSGSRGTRGLKKVLKRVCEYEFELNIQTEN